MEGRKMLNRKVKIKGKSNCLVEKKKRNRKGHEKIKKKWVKAHQISVFPMNNTKSLLAQDWIPKRVELDFEYFLKILSLN